jgi:glycosyltransferase involved in cell wall biosynthesis
LENVIQTGFVNQNELPLYLAACDILLLPNQPSKKKSSFGDNFIRWTSPMKLFEYMAVGRLIIASDLPVLREVLNEKNAILCPPGDVESWQKAIRQCWKDKATRELLASRAKRDVGKYDWSNRVASCLEYFSH